FSGFAASFLSACILSLFIISSVLMTLLSSFFLSKTFLKGKPSSFSLELPPYRKPKIIKTLIRSFFDRILFVLSRALISAAPAGALIWILANFSVNGSSLLQIISSFLDPIGHFFGLDGTILLGFILGLPANEIVIPIIMLTYLKNGAIADISDLGVLKTVLEQNGWTVLTGINLCIFSLFHWPCATTLLTIKKETRSIKITLISFLLPTVIGLSFCLLTRLIFG
ncbi:MAG: ferrous iron transporter B, partial [Clostridiales bacterium]|nr:ferrous iron transporter B [Candidatus Equinaster intestinalis]